MMINSLTSIGREAPFNRIVRYYLIIFLNLLVDWLNMLCSFWLTRIEVIWSYLVLKQLLVLPLMMNAAFLITISRSINICIFLWLYIVIAQGRWVKLSFYHVEMPSKLSSLEVISCRFAINPSIDIIVGALNIDLSRSLLLSCICFERLLVLLFVNMRFLVWFVRFFLN